MFIEMNRILNFIYLIIKLRGYYLGERRFLIVFINKEKENYYRRFIIGF